MIPKILSFFLRIIIGAITISVFLAVVYLVLLAFNYLISK
jgi:hypothetical protein